MKRNFILFFIIGVIVFSARTTEDVGVTEMQEHKIIPKPNSVIFSKGEYSINSKIVIQVDQSDDELIRLAHLLKYRLSLSTGVN